MLFKRAVFAKFCWLLSRAFVRIHTRDKLCYVIEETGTATHLTHDCRVGRFWSHHHCTLLNFLTALPSDETVWLRSQLYCNVQAWQEAIE